MTTAVHDSDADPGSVGEPPPDARTRVWVRVLLSVVIAGFAVFWIWALFFASKEAVNRVDDRAWAERAEQICLEATEERLELANLTRIDQADAELIYQRAEIVDESTEILERMLDDVVSVLPTDEKGQAIVPQWEADYRIYLDDRRAYADQLRETGENRAFYETADEGIPISERIATFAGDNDMSTCAPPIDLSR